jgi:hypothetical protein
VHFVSLINVLHVGDGGAGSLGDEQLAWATADLKARAASTPIVVFVHMPLWTVYQWPPWTRTTSGPDIVVWWVGALVPGARMSLRCRAPRIVPM